MIYRALTAEEIQRQLFDAFDRTQIVTKCRRKVDGVWVIRDCPFVDNWTEKEYCRIVAYLKQMVHDHGYVPGAFRDGQLKGFAAVEPTVFGTRAKYLNLADLHVSRDMRGMGIGRTLFTMAKEWAKAQGADKLYISSHSAVESQAFYQAMGCVEAAEYNQYLTEKEPCDCQLECSL